MGVAVRVCVGVGVGVGGWVVGGLGGRWKGEGGREEERRGAWMWSVEVWRRGGGTGVVCGVSGRVCGGVCGYVCGCGCGCGCGGLRTPLLRRRLSVCPRKAQLCSFLAHCGLLAWSIPTDPA